MLLESTLGQAEPQPRCSSADCSGCQAAGEGKAGTSPPPLGERKAWESRAALQELTIT